MSLNNLCGRFSPTNPHVITPSADFEVSKQCGGSQAKVSSDRH